MERYFATNGSMEGHFSADQQKCHRPVVSKAVKETEESTGISNLSWPLEISAQFLWVDANDGELGRPVKPLPSGLVGSNPTLPT